MVIKPRYLTGLFFSSRNILCWSRHLSGAAVLRVWVEIGSDFFLWILLKLYVHRFLWGDPPLPKKRAACLLFSFCLFFFLSFRASPHHHVFPQALAGEGKAWGIMRPFLNASTWKWPESFPTDVASAKASHSAVATLTKYKETQPCLFLRLEGDWKASWASSMGILPVAFWLTTFNGARTLRFTFTFRRGHHTRPPFLSFLVLLSLLNQEGSS